MKSIYDEVDRARSLRASAKSLECDLSIESPYTRHGPREWAVQAQARDLVNEARSIENELYHAGWEYWKCSVCEESYRGERWQHTCKIPQEEILGLLFRVSESGRKRRAPLLWCSTFMPKTNKEHLMCSRAYHCGWMQRVSPATSVSFAVWQVTEKGLIAASNQFNRSYYLP